MNSSIKSKLFGGFAILLLLLMAMAFFMISKFSESEQRLNEIVDSSSRKVSLSYEIMFEVLNVTRVERNLILEKDPIQQALYKEKISVFFENMDQKTSGLYELVDSQGKSILDEFKADWLLYRADVEEIMMLSLEGDQEKSLQVSMDGTKVRDRSINQLERLIDKNERDIQTDKAQSEESFQQAYQWIITLVIAGFLMVLLISFWIVQSINKRIAAITTKAAKIATREHADEKLEDPINDELSPVFLALASINHSFLEVTENANKVAAGDYTATIVPRSHRDRLGNALKKMTESLQVTTAANEKNTWLTSGLNLLNKKLMGNQDIEELANNIIVFLADQLNAAIGTVYLMNGQEGKLELKGQYAYISTEGIQKDFRLSEGLIGQAAREKKVLDIRDLTEDHFRITSSLLHAKPKHLVIIPFLFEDKVLGVIELGKLTTFNEQERELLNSSIESIALSVHSAIARRQIQELLGETQVQSEELQSQQEELKQMNEELEEQTQNLKQQQEELQMTNEELEEQTQSLEFKNREVEAAKEDIERKTKQLEISSKYKSEFLANMSHELRTPLNSLLILSKDLSENKLGNLNGDQVESADIIYKSGHDLLDLINEVLDLSRVEAGKMTLHIEKVHLRQFVNHLLRGFRHQAEQKGLNLDLELNVDLPEFISTDPQRLNQILKNLLSNAIKFTEKGSVTFRIERKGENSLAISVKDTGIGIKEDKQASVFEAFQQADGGTSRKYGGTGLGLSISRELARLLGAEISLTSKIDEGSTFTLVIPDKIVPEAVKPKPFMEEQLPLPPKESERFINYPTIKDDRGNLQRDDKVVLIIEDDLKFAGILMTQANQKGFRVLSAATGEDGLALARQYQPQAIILDMDLPGMNGRQVLTQIKASPEIRHIPVHIISVNERSMDAIREGAVEYLMKPIDKNDLEKAFDRIENFINRKMKSLLIVEDDANSRTAIRRLIGTGDVKCLEAGSGEEALKLYQENHIDCIVLDIGLPDMNGFNLIYKLEKIKGNVPPIIIYTGKELSKEEDEELQKYAESVIIKGVKSEERLLDETALFLHLTIKNLPESKQRIINNLYDKEAIFHDKKVLVVDDDMRNVFALSKVLKERGMTVIKAENGKRALTVLEDEPDMDLVLMDIMMPEMDGYEAMKKIRAQHRFNSLPIIALTAKAMKDDKKKCIEAGASDYITKPVDVARLLSLMRVWLSV